MIPLVNMYQGCHRQKKNTNLSFAVRPEIDAQTDEFIDCGIGALVNESSGESSEREEG